MFVVLPAMHRGRIHGQAPRELELCETPPTSRREDSLPYRPRLGSGVIAQEGVDSWKVVHEWLALVVLPAEHRELRHTELLRYISLEQVAVEPLVLDVVAN